MIFKLLFKIEKTCFHDFFYFKNIKILFKTILNINLFYIYVF
jgi:hypothetical protein